MLLLVKRRIRVGMRGIMVGMRGIGVEMRRVGGGGGENVGNRAGMR